MERLPENDSENFLSTCDIIRKAMNKIAKLKSSTDPSVCIFNIAFFKHYISFLLM